MASAPGSAHRMSVRRHLWLQAVHSYSCSRAAPHQQNGSIKSSSPSPLAFSRGLLDHAQGHLRVFRALIGRRAAHFVQGKMRALVVDLVREDLAARLPAGARRDAATAFLAGALFELLIWSLEARPPIPAEEADALFHELAGPALAAAGTPRARVADRAASRPERG